MSFFRSNQSYFSMFTKETRNLKRKTCATVYNEYNEHLHWFKDME